jgi:hypothetical protein
MNEYGFSQGIARNADESEYPGLWRGLIGLWVPSAGVQGARLTDFCNRGNLVNATAGPSWQPGGRRGNCLNFTSASSQYMTGGPALLSGVSKFTVLYWIKRTATSTHGVQFSQFQNNSNRFEVQPWNDNQLYATLGSGIWGNCAYTALNWTQIAAVFDGTQGTNATRLLIYINGLPQSLSFTGTIPATVPSIAANQEIGRASSPTQYGGGGFDDLRLYNRVLSPAEIMRSYMGASPLVRRSSPVVFRTTSTAAAIFRNRTGSRPRIMPFL